MMQRINGSLLRKYRLEAKMNMKQLAEGICTQSMISQIETGKAQPSEKLVHKLAERLSVSTTALQGE